MRPVVISAPGFSSSNSFAKMARNHAIWLYLSGVDLYIEERGEPSPVDTTPQWQWSHLNHLRHKSKKIPNNALWVFYDIPDGMKARPRQINLTTFETATLHPRWVSFAQAAEHVIAISHHNRYLLVSSGVDPSSVSVAGLGFDETIYSPDRSPVFPKHGSFVFLFVGHCNYRKGLDVLVHAFCDEFTADDNVQLRIVTQPMYGSGDPYSFVKDILSFHQKHPPVHVHSGTYNGGYKEDNMGSIYASGDCLVSPTLGEAFGLPLLEARACGLEVIATNCSGQRDFLSNENSFLINVQNVTEDPRCSSISQGYAGLRFWIPDHRHLRELMRAVQSGERRWQVPIGWEWKEKAKMLAEVLKPYGVIP